MRSCRSSPACRSSRWGTPGGSCRGHSSWYTPADRGRSRTRALCPIPFGSLPVSDRGKVEAYFHISNVLSHQPSISYLLCFALAAKSISPASHKRQELNYYSKKKKVDQMNFSCTFIWKPPKRTLAIWWRENMSRVPKPQTYPTVSE